MDIILYGADKTALYERAQKLIAKELGAKAFVYIMRDVCMVNPTVMNFAACAPFHIILADDIETPIALNNALSEVQRYREIRDKPNLVAVYCTTVNPLELKLLL